MKVDFYRHNVNKEDIEEVNKVLNSWFLTTGKWTEDFETTLAEYLRIPYVLGVGSCTHALHIALLIAGVKEGDEVITSPLTFISTSNSILYCNATPSFIDCDKYTGCIDIGALKGAITEKTKAILPVHLYGQLCNIEKLIKYTPETIQIVEDCAHALETPGRGQLGMSCYSFYPIKAITSGEGGAIAFWNKAEKEKAEILRLNGMDKDAWKRYSPESTNKKYKHWDMPELGFKYNMTNIQAALVIGQLRRVEELRARREKIFDTYYEELKKIEELTLPRIERAHSKLMFTFWVNPVIRDKVLVELQEAGIGVGVHYNPVHLTTYYRRRFRYKPGDFPNAERIGASTISIPCYSSLSKEEQDYVIKTIKEVMRKV